HLVRLRATGDEPRAREALWGNTYQLLGEALLRGVGEPFVVDVGELLGLLPRGFDDVFAAVAERRGHRATAHRVEVALARLVLDPHAVATLEDGITFVEFQREDMRRLTGHDGIPGSGHHASPDSPTGDKDSKRVDSIIAMDLVQIHLFRVGRGVLPIHGEVPAKPAEGLMATQTRTGKVI